MKCAGETFISSFIKMKHYKDTFNCSFIIIFLFSFTLFSLNFKPCSSACARAEYETGDEECCPMCAPGNRVYRDCTEYTSTTCVPCMGATFLDAPNGLKECFICMICDPGVGLRVRTACTRTSDTVCEPLPGFYCTEQHRGSCIQAKKHTKCRPGEFIQHMGSEKSDTVCEACSSGFYSPLGINCTRWTDCSVRDEVQQREGSAVEDVQCVSKASRHRYSIIPAAASALILLLLLIILFIKPKNPEKSHKNHREVNRGDKRDCGLSEAVQETVSSSAHTESSVVRLNFFRKGNRETRSAQP
uniref:Tumor necrosis factor receptor superfamily member 5-like n=1 Tax=Astyanax mexicanus TaxID=7994 RepID=A0A3B1IVD5_ASTMX